MDHRTNLIEIEGNVTSFCDKTPDVWMITDITDSDLPRLVLSKMGAIELALTILNRVMDPSDYYEYRHIANNQFSKLKDSIVQLMNEGWETVGGIEKNVEKLGDVTRPISTIVEYSQIMRRNKHGK